MAIIAENAISYEFLSHKERGTIMVLKQVDTQSNLKKWYNMNTKMNQKLLEIVQSHISFEEFE